ncbi:MAG: AbgT family transporter, partial [Planctomycetota bacterium]
MDPSPDARDESNRPTSSPEPRGAVARLLNVVEWLGNLLPHPVTLFALFALGVVVLSAITSWAGLSVEDPRPGREGQTFEVQSLLTGEGVRWMSQSLVTNFTGFVPLGTVLVALLGVGVAERSGLLTTAVRGLVFWAPKNLVTLVIVFAGVVSNTASEMGYVVLIPLAMAMYRSLGRHPLAGMAAAFAGVSGGYSANLLIGTVDPLLAGITQEAAQLIDPEYEVHPAVNWYFMIVSTFLIAGLGWFVTARIVEPRLGAYDESEADEDLEERAQMAKLTRVEIK